MLTMAELTLIARGAHDTWRLYSEAIGETGHPAWDDAPEGQRDEAMSGVLFHREDPDGGAAALHDLWRQLKTDEGWVYGPVKDAAHKIHPFLMPFAELPLDQQAKRHLFRAFVLATGRMLEDHRMPPALVDNRTHIERING